MAELRLKYENACDLIIQKFVEKNKVNFVEWTSSIPYSDAKFDDADFSYVFSMSEMGIDVNYNKKHPRLILAWANANLDIPYQQYLLKYGV
jgi:hypothetical protein